MFESNDGQKKNEQREDVFCTCGSLWSNSCFCAEECVDAEEEPGVIEIGIT